MTLQAHTEAAVAALTAENILVGRAHKPDGGGWQNAPGSSPFRPYVIVYGGGGGGTSGPLAAPDDDIGRVYQFTCVGASWEMAEQLQQEVRRILLYDQAVTVPGRALLQRVRLELEVMVTRDEDDPSHPLFYSADRYRIETTPA